MVWIATSSRRAKEFSFEVSNIESEIVELQGNGVEFADYDLPGLKTIDHIAVSGSMKAAWFEDPDGRIVRST